MKLTRKCLALVVAAGFLPVLGLSCAALVRDAVLAGAMDFVTGTVTDALANAVQTVAGGA